MGSSLISAFHRNKTNRPRIRLSKSARKSYENPQINYYARFLAKHPTQGEIRFYAILKHMRLHRGLLFQTAILNYIIDFMLPKHRIAIEIDGNSHENKKEYDQLRTKRLNENNIVVIRFTNQEVFDNSSLIIDRLNELMKVRKNQWMRKHPPKTRIYLANQYSQDRLLALIPKT